MRGLIAALALAVGTSRATASTYILLLAADPAPGCDAEFGAWWRARLGAVLTLPGVRRVEDYRRADVRLREGVHPMAAHLAMIALAGAARAPVAALLGRDKATDVVDPASGLAVLYRQTGVWHDADAAGVRYLQIVLVDAAQGRAADYEHWYRTRHGPELAAVAGVITTAFGIPAAFAASVGQPPAYLSAMQFNTRSVLSFKDELEQAARTTVQPTDTYDLTHAWRETYRLVERLKDNRR